MIAKGGATAEPSGEGHHDVLDVPTQSERRERRSSMKKKRHTPEEIAAKLGQADEMVAQGKLHSEVARALGVSIMTYHRWRKARAAAAARGPAIMARAHPHAAGDARIEDLQAENARLRRLVTDLLLEKMRLEETLGGKKTRAGGQ